MLGSRVSTVEKPSRHPKAPAIEAIAPSSGSPAASSPPKITTITTSVSGSATSSARSVSRRTCSLTSTLISGWPPIRTDASSRIPSGS